MVQQIYSRRILKLDMALENTGEFASTRFSQPERRVRLRRHGRHLEIRTFGSAPNWICYH